MPVVTDHARSEGIEKVPFGSVRSRTTFSTPRSEPRRDFGLLRENPRTFCNALKARLLKKVRGPLGEFMRLRLRYSGLTQILRKRTGQLWPLSWIGP